MVTNESILVAARVLFAGVVVAVVVAILLVRAVCAGIWRLARQ
jgi:hypothetical protein